MIPATRAGPLWTGRAYVMWLLGLLLCLTSACQGAFSEPDTPVLLLSVESASPPRADGAQELHVVAKVPGVLGGELTFEVNGGRIAGTAEKTLKLRTSAVNGDTAVAELDVVVGTKPGILTVAATVAGFRHEREVAVDTAFAEEIGLDTPSARIGANPIEIAAVLARMSGRVSDGAFVRFTAERVLTGSNPPMCAPSAVGHFAKGARPNPQPREGIGMTDDKGMSKITFVPDSVALDMGSVEELCLIASTSTEVLQETSLTKSSIADTVVMRR